MSTPPIHTYPLGYPPGSHWAVSIAWEILDTLPPGVLSSDQRDLLAGQISGSLVRVAGESLAALTPRIEHSKEAPDATP